MRINLLTRRNTSVFFTNDLAEIRKKGAKDNFTVIRATQQAGVAACLPRQLL